MMMMMMMVTIKPMIKSGHGESKQYTNAPDAMTPALGMSAVDSGARPMLISITNITKLIPHSQYNAFFSEVSLIRTPQSHPHILNYRTAIQ